MTTPSPCLQSVRVCFIKPVQRLVKALCHAALEPEIIPLGLIIWLSYAQSCRVQFVRVFECIFKVTQCVFAPESYLTCCRLSRKCFSTGPYRCDCVFESRRVWMHNSVCVCVYSNGLKPSASWTPHENYFFLLKGVGVGTEWEDRVGSQPPASSLLVQKSSAVLEDLLSSFAPLTPTTS